MAGPRWCNGRDVEGEYRVSSVGKEDRLMPNHRAGVLVAVITGLTMLGIATARADPLPTFCAPATVVDDVCTARLTTVTADTTNGTITGTPVGGGAAVTLAGPAEAYLKSVGFGATPPDPVQNWDATIDRVSHLDTSGPDWYGNAKSRVFLPRSLNDIATQFPPNVLVVRFAPDDAQPGTFRLVSIQPTAQ
jgi:hypothetical protein